MKVEVFREVEEIDSNESGYVQFSRERYNSEYFGGMPEAVDFSREQYKVRTVAQVRALPTTINREHVLREKTKLLQDGFKERDRTGYEDPRLILFDKRKDFVIADKMIDSYIGSMSEEDPEILDKRGMNLLLIDLVCEVNKQKTDLESKKELIGNYRAEYLRLQNSHRYLKSRNIFQRIFLWKKSIKE